MKLTNILLKTWACSAILFLTMNCGPNETSKDKSSPSEKIPLNLIQDGFVASETNSGEAFAKINWNQANLVSNSENSYSGTLEFVNVLGQRLTQNLTISEWTIIMKCCGGKAYDVGIVSPSEDTPGLFLINGVKFSKASPKWVVKLTLNLESSGNIVHEKFVISIPPVLAAN